MKRHLKGGRIVDPARGVDAAGDLWIDGDRVVAPPADPSGFEVVDCAGCWIMPGFVDLYGEASEAEDREAARLGGFTTVVQAPTPGLDRPLAVRDLLARDAGLAAAPAATLGLQGTALSDLGTFSLLPGVVGVSHGRAALGDPRVLRGLLEYAATFDLLVFLRGAEPALEEGGLAKDGGRAAWLGLPGIPGASEEIGIARIAALARLTGARVHVSMVWTAEGVGAVADARARGAALTASTTVHHLALDDTRLIASGYAGIHRLVPPLGDDADRAALRQGLRDGVLDAVATDHRPLPAVAQEVELARAEPGATGFRTALPLVLGALGDPLSVASALATGPARVLGRAASLAPGAAADVVVVDPEARWTVGAPLGSYTNTPLHGENVRGAVRWTFGRGRVLAGPPALR